MGTENLKNTEAITKLKELVDKIDVGMVGSREKDGKNLHFVPMSRQEVDDNGSIWMLFSSKSETHTNLSKNPQVDITYADVGSYSFLVVKGTVEISRDQARIDKYWNKMMEGWFEKGKDDPHIRILKVIPEDAHYWDTQSNKLVTFFKVAANALTGSNMDVGREGDLKV